MCVAFAFMLLANVESVSATTVQNAPDIETVSPSFVEDYYPELKNSKTTFQWEFENTTGITVSKYEVLVSSDEAFSTANTVSYESTGTSVDVPASVFGKNGGWFYVKVRAVGSNAEGQVVNSAYSEVQKYAFVKINKTNFPGLYKILKDWKCCDDRLNKSYTNKDAWIDPLEINDLYVIDADDAHDPEKVGSGNYKVSSLKGIEYFTNLEDIIITNYTGGTIKLTQPNIKNLDIRYKLKNKTKKIKVVAPYLKKLNINTYYSSLKSVQVDAKKLESLTIKDKSGTDHRNINTLKLSSMPNLKYFYVWGIEAKNKKLNLNKYTNLQKLYIMETNYQSVDASKCKKLKEVYCYTNKNLKTLNLKNCKKIKYVGSYNCPKLTTKGVKLPKNKKSRCKLEQGIWW